MKITESPVLCYSGRALHDLVLDHAVNTMSSSCQQMEALRGLGSEASHLHSHFKKRFTLGSKMNKSVKHLPTSESDDNTGK